jgi:hypothetical protein
MSAKKPQGIPLAELLKPTPANNRNLDILLGNDGTNQPGERTVDAKLMQAMARKLRSSRDAAETKAAPFRSGRPGGQDRDDEQERRQQIRALGLEHPDKSARDLYNSHAAHLIRRHMSAERFANILSEEAPRRKKRIK